MSPTPAVPSIAWASSPSRDSTSAARARPPPVDNFDCPDRKLVEAIRAKLLGQYRDDLNDLKEHASQETQTRRDYTGRAFWELLQNADDAMAPAGRPSSELIGAKGLGFKSVLEVTEHPEIHSGAFHFAFDPERSEALLRGIIPCPPRLVFRLPHMAKPDPQVRRMRASGFVTVIKLPFKDEESRRVTEEGLKAFPHQFMLLTQHLRIFEAQFRDGSVRRLAPPGWPFPNEWSSRDTEDSGGRRRAPGGMASLVACLAGADC